MKKQQPTATNFDDLHSWIVAIQQEIGDCTSVPIYIIGTKKDQLTVDDKIKEIRDKIVGKTKKGKTFRKNMKIIFVNNKCSGTTEVDDGVQELQQLLYDVMCSEESGAAIPMSYLPFTLIAQQYAQNEGGRPWLTRKEVETIAREGCKLTSEDVDGLLEFNHAVGHILYYGQNKKLSDRAIVNIQWLILMVSSLFVPKLTDDFNQAEFSDRYDLLEKRGILVESLAEHIWRTVAKVPTDKATRDYLFGVMEQFSLLYSAQRKKSVEDEGILSSQRYFFVPSLALLPDEEPPANVIKSKELILYNQRADDPVPQTLYWNLVVKCMLTCSEGVKDPEDPYLRHNLARIKYGRAKVVLRYHRCHGIGITVEKEKRRDDDPAVRLKLVCDKVVPLIERQLHELKTTSCKHFEWEKAIRCCSCSDNNDETDHLVKLDGEGIPTCRSPSVERDTRDEDWETAIKHWECLQEVRITLFRFEYSGFRSRVGCIAYFTSINISKPETHTHTGEPCIYQAETCVDFHSRF